jgi:hypothetical protein
MESQKARVKDEFTSSGLYNPFVYEERERKLDGAGKSDKADRSDKAGKSDEAGKSD